MKTLLLRDEIFREHRPEEGSPETPARIEALYADLDSRPLPFLRAAAPRAARRDELLRIHTPAYLERVAATAGRARDRLDADTTTSERSHEAALRAAGAVMQACETVVSGSAQGAFALVRPPGHHAERDRAMGFCLFNNVAVAAAHALSEGGLKRILVLDVDVHHGNGTQQAFWERKEVLFVSSHQWPLYPGTGWFDEVGAGAGAGFTVNLPMPAGMGDAEYLYLYKRIVEPVVDAWRPELILVSAGFDTWKDDPLGGMRVTGEGYAALFALFADWARRHCPGRLALALEGGYDPAGLVAGVRAALEALGGDARPREGLAGRSLSPRAREVALQASAALQPYWNSLKTAEKGPLRGPGVTEP